MENRYVMPIILEDNINPKSLLAELKNLNKGASIKFKKKSINGYGEYFVVRIDYKNKDNEPKMTFNIITQENYNKLKTAGSNFIENTSRESNLELILT